MRYNIVPHIKIKGGFIKMHNLRIPNRSDVNHLTNTISKMSMGSGAIVNQKKDYEETGGRIKKKHIMPIKYKY